MVGGKALKLREWKARAGKVNRRQTELSWTVGDCPPPRPLLRACSGPENRLYVSDSQSGCTLEPLGHLFKLLMPRTPPDQLTTISRGGVRHLPFSRLPK